MLAALRSKWFVVLLGIGFSVCAYWGLNALIPLIIQYPPTPELIALAALGLGLPAASLLGYSLRAPRSLDGLIRQGLQQQQFLPYYQPVIDSRNGEVISAEALARWTPSDDHVLTPSLFLPGAQQCGLVSAITDQLLEHIARDIKTYGWDSKGFSVSFNTIPEQLENGHLFDRLQALAKRHDIDLDCFSIELNDRSHITDMAATRAQLQRFRDKNIAIQIDGTGTGYRGFTYLQELPVKTLKIDKMFTDVLTHPGDMKMQVLAGIINFGHDAGLNIIAEGVETQEQIEYLSLHNVYNIQGFVYAKPMQANVFAHWLKHHADGSLAALTQ